MTAALVLDRYRCSECGHPTHVAHVRGLYRERWIPCGLAGCRGWAEFECEEGVA